MEDYIEFVIGKSSSGNDIIERRQRIRHCGTDPCEVCLCKPDELHSDTCMMETCPRCEDHFLACSCATTTRKPLQGSGHLR